MPEYSILVVVWPDHDWSGDVAGSEAKPWEEGRPQGGSWGQGPHLANPRAPLSALEDPRGTLHGTLDDPRAHLGNIEDPHRGLLLHQQAAPCPWDHAKPSQAHLSPWQAAEPKHEPASPTTFLSV